MKIILRSILVILLITVTCIAVGCSFVGEPESSESSKETEIKETKIEESENGDEQSESTADTEQVEDNNSEPEPLESNKETEIEGSENGDEQSESIIADTEQSEANNCEPKPLESDKEVKINESEKDAEQPQKNTEQDEDQHTQINNANQPQGIEMTETSDSIDKPEETNDMKMILEPYYIIKDNIINKENLFGMWESSPQDSEGQSQLLIYNRDNTSFDFQFYNFEELAVNGINQMNQYGFSGTAKFLDEDTAEFEIDDSLRVDFYTSAYGSIEFIDSTIQISFKYESYNKLHTIQLTKVNNENIIKKRAELPFYYRELSIMGEPIYNISLTNADELFGEPLNKKLEEHYENEFREVRTYDGYEIKFMTPTEYDSRSMILAITITKPGISIIRGIQVGDDIRDVINKFSNENREMINEYGRFYLPLYGKAQHPGNFGQVLYENGKPIRVRFSELGYLFFELDDNLKVSSIEYYLP